MHIDQVRRDRNVVGAAAIAISDVVRIAVEQSTGLSGSGPAALVAVVADPGLSIDELRRVLRLTHPGTVRLVDRLVDKGWVRRQRGIGRAVLLIPTPSGRAAQRRLAKGREAALAELLAQLPENDVHSIAVMLAPIPAATINDVDAMRRLCRLCDRDVCQNCPAEAAGA
jgi:MarR family transcriptional repressor of emrRAB